MKDIDWKESAIDFVCTLVACFVVGIFWFDHGNLRAALVDAKLWFEATGLAVVMVIVHVAEDLWKGKKKHEAEHLSSVSEN